MINEIELIKPLSVSGISGVPFILCTRRTKRILFFIVFCPIHQERGILKSYE